MRAEIVHLNPTRRPPQVVSTGDRIYVGAPGQRWTPKRKAALVDAIVEGRLSAEQAESQHGITADELAGWMDDYGRGEGGRASVRALRISDPFEHRARRKRRKIGGAVAANDRGRGVSATSTLTPMDATRRVIAPPSSSRSATGA